MIKGRSLSNINAYMNGKRKRAFSATQAVPTPHNNNGHNYELLNDTINNIRANDLLSNYPHSPRAHNSPLQQHFESERTNNCNSGTIGKLLSNVFDKAYTSGELIIKVVEADLHNIGPAHDCYCVIKAGGKRLKTTVITKDHKPVWNEGFIFDITDSEGSQSIIEIQLRSYSRMGKGHKLGTSYVTCTSLTDAVMHDSPYPLIKRRRKQKRSMYEIGRIRLQITYTSALRQNLDYMLAREKYDFLTKVLFDDDCAVACALCQTYQENDLSMALIRLFNSNGDGCALNLLKNLLVRHINNHEDEANALFRSDSMVTKMTRNYFHLIGRNTYLKPLFLPLVEEVSDEISAGNSYEISPEMMQEGDDLCESVPKLRAIVRKLMNSILLSVDVMPVNMKKYFRLLGDLLTNKFDELSLDPARTVFFLRFIGPSILFPSEHGIISDAIDRETSRTLVVICKILQSIATGCPFGEPHMAPFNDLVSYYTTPLHNFLESLCVPAQTMHEISGAADDTRTPYSQEELTKLLSIVVRKMHVHFHKFGEKLLSDPYVSAASEPNKYQEFLAQLESLVINNSSPS